MTNSDSRPVEQPAVRTTIVGGRPPGSGKGIGDIPRGIEVLVKKASVDPAFRAVLLERRAEAADEIGLALDGAEVMMLNAVPREQLESIIAHTSVHPETRRAFLGRAAALMLAALGATVAVPGCGGVRPEWRKTRGSQPDRPGVTPPNEVSPTDGIRPDRPVSKGMQPDRPDVTAPSQGIRPDQPTTRGIQPDRPSKAEPDVKNPAE